MFLKATTPLIRDTVIIRDANDDEITRFVAIWKRPDSHERKALLKARMDIIQRIQSTQQSIQENNTDYDMSMFDQTLQSIEENSKAQIRQQLNSIDGLLDDSDQLVDFTPAVMDELFRWAEYTNPLAESLARLAEGRTVEEAQTKNSEPPVLSGQVPVEMP